MTPRFYRASARSPTARADRRLRARARPEEPRATTFNFANVADPHVNPDLAGQIAQINSTAQSLAFIQVSGDLTNNATDAEFQYYRNATAASRLPVWPAVGNHEYFGGGQPTYAGRIDNYRRYVGPEWYSFDYGNRHFVVFDNCGGAPFDEQRDWVKRDLEANAPGKRVVVLMHQPMNIPFGSPSQYDDYAELFEAYETELILVGHEHSNDTDTEWVKGAKHIQTNSSSYTIDHSPRGFRYVHMARDSFDNPFRMYGVQRSLASPRRRRTRAWPQAWTRSRSTRTTRPTRSRASATGSTAAGRGVSLQASPAPSPGSARCRRPPRWTRAGTRSRSRRPPTAARAGRRRRRSA